MMIFYFLLCEQRRHLHCVQSAPSGNGNDAYYVQGDEELWKIAKEISSSENAQGEVKRSDGRLSEERRIVAREN